MKNTIPTKRASTSQPLLQWRGLGLWNLYFIAKLVLYWTGFLNFDIYYNVVFAAALLLPLGPLWLHRLRHIIAIPVGVALLYYDTWLPPFRRLLERPEVLNFSNDYLLDLVHRFINWNMVGAGLVLLVVYLFLAQWLRMTLFTVVALALVAIPSLHLPALPSLQWSTEVAAIPTTTTATAGNTPKLTSTEVINKPISEVLNDELEGFYQLEKNRFTEFKAPADDAIPFDLLFLNICSLSWADLEASSLLAHPLFKKMDIIFDDFNSATSYSGPAVSRLMQANCGQASHQNLYEPTDKQCSLFSSLNDLGFDAGVALNHNGQFQGFIDEFTTEAAFTSTLVPTNLKPVLRGFDDSPIWSDYDTLDLWLNNKQASQSTKPSALLYNSITLHDGNSEATAEGSGSLSPYGKRAQQLLDDLDAFMNQLERSGRQVAVVFIPEHGAALEGDKMQVSGMREVPTPDITHVPVGIRLIGDKSVSAPEPIHITTPSSFLALSELISRLISEDVFDQSNIDWDALAVNLAQTRFIAENEGTVMMEYEGTYYVRLNGKNWIKYKL